MSNLYLVELASDTCASCANLRANIDHDLLNKYQITYEYVDDVAIIKRYQKIVKIDKLPTLILIKQGTVIGRLSGNQPAEILEYWLVSSLES